MTDAYDGDDRESRAAFRAYDSVNEPVSGRSTWQIWRDACAWQAARATAEQSEPKLDKRAQVGNTRFGVGIKWSTVIGAAQRFHDFMTTPEKESERTEKGKAFLDVLTACGQADATSDAKDAARWRIIHATLPDDELDDLATTVASDNGLRSTSIFGKSAVELIDAAIESKPAEQSTDARDAARYRWATEVSGNADILHSIVLCHEGDDDKIRARIDAYRAVSDPSEKT